MQGFDQMWQNGIGFTATSIWQVPFRFCRGFSTATILDRGDLKILGFCSVTLSLKKTGQKVTSLLVMVHKLARHTAWKLGLQPAPICKQTLQNAWCLRKLESLQATCRPVLSFLKYEDMSCFFTSFSLCWAVPTYVDIQLDKKGEKPTEAWTCAKFNVVFSLAFTFSKALRKPLGVCKLDTSASTLLTWESPWSMSPWDWPTRYMVTNMSLNSCRGMSQLQTSQHFGFFNPAVALPPFNRIVLGMSTPLCSSTLALIGLHRWHVDQCQV